MKIKLDEAQAPKKRLIDGQTAPVFTERFFLIKEMPCPACGGDGWTISENEACAQCVDGVVYVQLATIPETEVEGLVRRYGQDSNI